MKRWTFLTAILIANFFLAANSYSQGHFVPAFSGNGEEHMNINVVEAKIGGVSLEAGDEIAVFDGTICCGKVILSQPIVFSNPGTFVSIAASKTETGMSNGFTAGNPITIKFWDSSKRREMAGISANFINTSGATITAPKFTVGASTFVKLSVIAIPNQTPVSNAGIDQSVNEGVSVTLNGSGSSDPDYDVLQYAWIAPAGITLSSTTTAKPTFTAPQVSVNTNYTFSLVVNDGTVNSIADQVIVTVKQVNKAPSANAGIDQSVNEGTVVTLDGSLSADPDASALTYTWTAPAGITLSSTTTAKPTFTAPQVSVNTNYTFSLVVNDGTVNSVVDQVIVTVKQVNKAPTANAGIDQSVNEGTVVTLNGSVSSDPDGSTLTYIWTAPAGITLSSTTAAKPTFTAPQVSVNTNYIFSLVVNDGTVNSVVDQVVVTVKVVSQPSGDQTLGNTEVYTGTSAVSYRRAMPVTFNESGEIQSISLFHNGGTGNVLLGVYSDQGGLPSSKLAVSAVTIVNTTAGWQTVSLVSPVSVTAGQTLWLSWVFQNSVGVRYTSGTPSRIQSIETWSSGMPATFGAGTILGNKFSIYCTYTPKAIFGNTEIYTGTSAVANRRAMPVTFSESGDIQSISIYHNGGTGNVLLGVYSDQSGLPSSQLGVTAATVVNSSAGWQTVSLKSPVKVISGQTFWMSWVFQNSVGVRYTSGTPGRAQSSSTWSSGMPTTYGAATTVSNKFSIYCTYTSFVKLGNAEVYDGSSAVANRRAMPVTFGESGEIQSISLYHNGGTGNVLLGVYSDQSGLPSTQLGVTAATVVNSNAGWQTVSLTNPLTVVSGQTLWLSWVFQNSVGVRYTTGTPGRAQSLATWSAGMPSTFGTSTILGNKFSIYCTYAPISSDPLKSVFLTLGCDPLSHNSEGVLIYPNPTKGNVQLKFVNMPEKNTWITVFDLSGMIICKLQIDSKEQTLDLHGNPPGIYLIKIDQKNPKTYKLVLE
jgi:hypothetical protein